MDTTEIAESPHDEAERAADVAAPDPSLDLPSDRFLDRELSWVEFNRRVLLLAQSPDLPLLERARFLAIFATNLDEFLMVRIAGLQRRIETGIATQTASGLTTREQLTLVMTRALELAREHAQSFCTDVLPALRAEGIDIVRWSQLGESEQELLRAMFRDEIFPVLTPLAVDPVHPFPYISGLSLNLAVVVRDPDSETERFARVKVPPLLPRFVPLDGGRFVPLEDVIAAHLPDLFAGMEIVETHVFRVTRNEDVEVEDEEVDDLLKALERELIRRRFGPPVRLEVEDSVSDRVLALLCRELRVSEGEVFRLPAPLDLTGLWSIAHIDRPDLKQPTHLPVTPPAFLGADTTEPRIFPALRQSDVLVHHPYDSFATTVQAFLEEAAADPAVLAIKQTLYRTSGESPIVDALIDAAQAGKQVLVLVELKARFDEQANIRWARALEEAGCHVVYGLVGLKTHCKLCLVVRREDDGSLRRYAHVGTGNYHPKTARIYEDVGIMTADHAVGEDLSHLFNHLSGYTVHPQYRRLLVAPDDLRAGLIERVEREVAHHAAGRPAGIRWKVNALVDEDVIDALYHASRAGVPVDLAVRSMCALRPGVPGLSDTVRVVSILGRFLEHSRIYRFANGGAPETWMGSADVMHRNLDRRVEAMLNVTDPESQARLTSVLDLALSGHVRLWELQPDGSWAWRTDGDLVDYQEELIRRSVAATMERTEQP
ncbi:MAG: RNA degradosome polyphosphate kinase [Frankiaceae bacterium]